LVVLGLVLAAELLEQRAALGILEVHRVVAEQQPLGGELLLERVVHAARGGEHALHGLEETHRGGLLHDDGASPDQNEHIRRSAFDCWIAAMCEVKSVTPSFGNSSS